MSTIERREVVRSDDVRTTTRTSPIPENTSKNTHNVVFELLAEEADCRKVLDVPCGAGAFTKRLLDVGVRVVAADCQNILHLDGADFASVAMNEALPFAEDEFDAIVCIDGIEPITRPFDFINECRRITRRGGVLIISTPNLMALRSRWRWLLTGFHQGEKIPLDESRPTPLHHVSLVSFTDLRYRLHTRGFRITGIRANRYRLIGAIYGVLAPVAYLMTRWVFRKEGRRSTAREQNREIMDQIFSAPVLFGETLIVKAVCEKQMSSKSK